MVHMQMTLSKLSDRDLYERCQEYGGNAKEWLRRFAGLLPEVYKRRLYKKHGFVSIHEFAKKLGGMNERTVDKVINLAHRLEGLPMLRALLESGEVGWSKVEVVVAVAQPENQATWVKNLKELTKNNLVKAVKQAREDFKLSAGGHGENKITILQDWGHLGFPISPHIEQKFRSYKHQCEKKKGCRLSWNQVLEIILKGEPLHKEVVEVVVCPDCAKRKGLNAQSRAVPVAVERLVLARYKGKCGFPGCKMPYQELHHIVPYEIVQNHDPDNLVTLCKDHHSLLHAGMVENASESPEKWHIRKTPKLSETDRRVQSHIRKS